MESISVKMGELRQKFVKTENEDKYCRTCRGTGIAIINEKRGKMIYEYAYKCQCRAGQARKEAYPMLPMHFMVG